MDERIISGGVEGGGEAGVYGTRGGSHGVEYARKEAQGLS